MDNMSLSDIAAVTRGENGDGWGSGSWWIIVLFLFAFMGGGFGFGNRGPNGEPVTEAGLCNAMNFNDLQNAVGRLSDNENLHMMQLSQGLARPSATRTCETLPTRRRRSRTGTTPLRASSRTAAARRSAPSTA